MPDELDSQACALGIDVMKHVRLDVGGAIEEVTAHGWNHVDMRTFLDQFFAVSTPG